MSETKYLHGEAYCLMKYRGEDTDIVEWIWNSRDGVTPFICESRLTALGRERMYHVDWPEDVRIPNYIPPVGTRIFVDQDEQSARDVMLRLEASIGPAPANIRSDVMERIMLFPRVVVVTAEIRDRFRRAAER